MDINVNKAELNRNIKKTYIRYAITTGVLLIFMSGTAAEITPVRSVDGIQVGAGRRGPVTLTGTSSLDPSG